MTFRECGRKKQKNLNGGFLADGNGIASLFVHSKQRVVLCVSMQLDGTVPLATQVALWASLVEVLSVSRFDHKQRAGSDVRQWPS